MSKHELTPLNDYDDITQLIDMFIAAMAEIEVFPNATTCDRNMLHIHFMQYYRGDRDEFCLLKKDGDEVVSFMVGKTLESGFCTDRFAHVVLSYTKPEYRGQGIVSQMFDEFVEWAKGKGANRLTCLPADCAVEMCEKKGFQRMRTLMARPLGREET